MHSHTYVVPFFSTRSVSDIAVLRAGAASGARIAEKFFFFFSWQLLLAMVRMVGGGLVTVDVVHVKEPPAERHRTSTRLGVAALWRGRTLPLRGGHGACRGRRRQAPFDLHGRVSRGRWPTR